MRENRLDEMQLQKRNKIGNQVFIVLFYLLFADMGLYGLGFRWLEYPANVLIIMTLCMTYYLFRLIWGNAYIGPLADNRPAKSIMLVVTAAVFVSAAILFFVKKTGIQTPVTGSNDNSGLVLFVFSAVSLILLLIGFLVRRRQNKDE